MQKAPFDTKYDGLVIRVNTLAIADNFWEMDAKKPIEGTAFSQLWVHHAARTDLLGDGTITTNIALILRNQSDYSNCIILMTTCSIKSDVVEKSERMLSLLTEFLFEKAGEYAVDKDLKGLDQKNFIVPDFRYTDDYFTQELNWSFQ